MNTAVELSGFSFLLLLASIFIVIRIRLADSKKTVIARVVVILAAVVIYSVAIMINLQPIQANGNEVVYITQTGSKYHSSECRHLRQSSIKVSLEQAINNGYGDCSHCYVPQYVPETIHRSFSDLYSSKGVLFMILGGGCAALFLALLLCWYILMSLNSFSTILLIQLHFGTQERILRA